MFQLLFYEQLSACYQLGPAVEMWEKEATFWYSALWLICEDFVIAHINDQVCVGTLRTLS
jgi:hypothetical protein